MSGVNKYTQLGAIYEYGKDYVLTVCQLQFLCLMAYQPSMDNLMPKPSL